MVNNHKLLLLTLLQINNRRAKIATFVPMEILGSVQAYMQRGMYQKRIVTHGANVAYRPHTLPCTYMCGQTNYLLEQINRVYYSRLSLDSSQNF